MLLLNLKLIRLSKADTFMVNGRYDDMDNPGDYYERRKHNPMVRYILTG